MTRTITIIYILTFLLSYKPTTIRVQVFATQTQTEESDENPPKKRIINGKIVDNPRYPYFSLFYGRSLCGGVLISPRLVLSAAHCEGSSSQIRIGAFKDPGDGERVNILSTSVHPDYDHSRFDNDMIIFQLERDVGLPYIQLGPEYVSGGTYTVIGFGDTDKGPDLVLSNVLQEVELDYVDPDECDAGHGDRNEVQEDMMCAAGELKDSCIGDSGGPMIRKGVNSFDDTLVGIVSWGRGCAEPGVPGVYSRISYFYDWILETICEKYAEDAPYYIRCGSGSVIFSFTDEPTDSPTSTSAAYDYIPREPTTSPSRAPVSTAWPSYSAIVSNPPIMVPNTNNTDQLTDFRKDLEFIAWTPTIKLNECQGDCDTDSDCQVGFICFKRNGQIHTKDVPGCRGTEFVADNIDVCVYPW